MTTTTPTSSATTNPATTAAAADALPARQQLAGNFDTFLTLLTTQLQNQDPLISDGYQSVHRAACRVCRGRAADQHEHQPATLISMQQTSEASQALQLVGSNVTINGNTATLSKATGSPATWGLYSPSPATGTITITSSTGQVAYTGTMPLNPPAARPIPGTARAITASLGRTATTPCRSPPPAPPARRSPSPRRCKAPSAAVNVSQNPPLVTVGGQSYPISAIQSINSGSIGNSISNSANSISNSANSLSNSLSNSISTANNSSLAQLLH